MPDSVRVEPRVIMNNFLSCMAVNLKHPIRQRQRTARGLRVGGPPARDEAVQARDANIIILWRSAP